MDVYQDREQTAAKHLILSKYLEELAFKVGIFKRGCTLNYIDGFSGPWESKSEDLSDTSPGIALARLSAARVALAKLGHQLDVRAFFVSKDESGASRLSRLEDQFPEAKVEVRVGEFENHIDAARRFARTGDKPFTFVFIDPTGWTGFGLRAISPLLQEGHTEVLLNFMTGHVSRFIDTDDTKLIPSFVDLFGDASYREAWRGIQGLDREEQMVEKYCGRLREAGQYRHCVSAVILKPTSDRTHYHLVYGTTSDEGLVTFRGVEHKTLGFQSEQRAGAQQRKRVSRTGQPELFPGRSMIAQPYETELRERYLSRAYRQLDELIQQRDEVPWNDLVMAALGISLVTEPDVKRWLAARMPLIEVVGLKAGERTPKRDRGHRIRLRTRRV